MVETKSHDFFGTTHILIVERKHWEREWRLFQTGYPIGPSSRCQIGFQQPVEEVSPSRGGQECGVGGGGVEISRESGNLWTSHSTFVVQISYRLVGRCKRRAMRH